MRSKTNDQPVQTLVAGAPPVQFVTADSGRRVIEALRGEYQRGVDQARQGDFVAGERRREREDLERQLQHLREQHGQVEAAERVALKAAEDGRNVVRDAAALLAHAGVDVPAEVEAVQVSPLASPQGDANGHAAQFGGPVQPFPADPADGFCINCGQPAWKKPASPHHPKGATHSFGATCDPNADEPTYADLGERAEAGR
ncbi:hypothetical protein [Streptosporangium sandarakinum]